MTAEEQLDRAIENLSGVGGRVSAEKRSSVRSRAAHFIPCKGEREIQAVEKRSGVYPHFGFVGIASWRLALIERFADAANPLHERHGRIHIGAKGANSGGDKLEGSFYFGAVGIASPEFRRINHR